MASKARISSLTTAIKHYTEGSSQKNKTKKCVLYSLYYIKYKYYIWYTDLKGKKKSLFTDGMITQVDSPKESAKQNKTHKKNTTRINK